METLSVRVNDELVLAAGTVERMSILTRIHPPPKTMFHQVLEYLRKKPDPTGLDSSFSVMRAEGVAAMAVTIRWGSYFAVLVDYDKPAWDIAKQVRLSRICDTEMQRINIESSAALAEWVGIMRRDFSGEYSSLVRRAVAYLPLLRRSCARRRGMFLARANADLGPIFDSLVQCEPQEISCREEAMLIRKFANCGIHHAWRNGAIERIHAGKDCGFRLPLDKRRLAPSEERAILNSTASSLGDVMFVADSIKGLQSKGASLDQCVRPFTHDMFLAPSRWTLTQNSSEVLLIGPEVAG